MGLWCVAVAAAMGGCAPGGHELWNTRTHQDQKHLAEVLILDGNRFVFHKLSDKNLCVLTKSKVGVPVTSFAKPPHHISTSYQKTVERIVSIKIDTNHLALVKRPCSAPKGTLVIGMA